MCRREVCYFALAVRILWRSEWHLSTKTWNLNFWIELNFSNLNPRKSKLCPRVPSIASRKNAFKCVATGNLFQQIRASLIINDLLKSHSQRESGGSSKNENLTRRSSSCNVMFTCWWGICVSPLMHRSTVEVVKFMKKIKHKQMRECLFKRVFGSRRNQ